VQYAAAYIETPPSYPVLVTVTVDPDNIHAETNERDNVLKLRITWPSGEGPSDANSRCARV
jgi:hypothetical protein